MFKSSHIAILLIDPLTQVRNNMHLIYNGDKVILPFIAHHRQVLYITHFLYGLPRDLNSVSNWLYKRFFFQCRV